VASRRAPDTVKESSHDTAARFAQAWLREQQALWQHCAASGSEQDFAAAEAAWMDACDRWWQQVGSAVPAPLAAQLQAALQHTRVMLRFARTLAGGGSQPGLDAVADPALLFTAALDAIGRATGGTHASAAAEPYAEEPYTRAYAALIAELSDIAVEAFAAARERAAGEPVQTARELYALYAQTIEAHYRARAGSDAFAHLVGDMVNAQVDALAARRRDSR
jgi:hypothetical protein